MFPGGRIEEFIESRTLTVSEWLTDTTVNREIAVTVGKLHSVIIPISKKPWNLIEKVQESLDKFNQVKQTYQEEGYLSTPMASALQKFDFDTEIQFIKSVLGQLKQRVIFGTNDMNRSNFLRLKDEKTGKDIEPCKIMAIDYEFSCYNYRSYDLGNYFGMRVFDFGGGEKFTEENYPSEEFIKSFVEKYIETIRSLANKPFDWDEDGIDSIDHIMMEIAFGSFAVRLINMAWILRDLPSFSKLPDKQEEQQQPEEIPAPFSKFYNQRKQHFLMKYPQFAV